MRATLGTRQGVDLIHDHPLNGAERLPSPRREQQVERLRRRDQDVRRAFAEGTSLIRRRITGPDTDPDWCDGSPTARRGQCDACHGRTEIAVHVMDQGLQGRHIQHPQPVERFRGFRVAHQPVQTPQERSERLAAAGRRTDEGVLPSGDSRPAQRLRGRRRLERRPEPIPGGGPERLERVGHTPWGRGPGTSRHWRPSIPVPGAVGTSVPCLG